MSYNADGVYQGHTAVDDEYEARLTAVTQYNTTAQQGWRMDAGCPNCGSVNHDECEGGPSVFSHQE